MAAITQMVKKTKVIDNVSELLDYVNDAVYGSSMN